MRCSSNDGGNVIVWKPAETQMYSAHVIMKLFKEAGLPDGVINMVVADGPTAGEVVFNHKDFAGLHFTGSTAVFKNIWKKLSEIILKSIDPIQESLVKLVVKTL